MDRPLATEIVGTHYPQRAVTGVEPATAGHRPTAIVRFDSHPPLVVQLSADIGTVRTEAALVETVRSRTTIPVPRIRAIGTHDQQAYAISEYLAGTNLHTVFADSAPDRQREFARQFGRYLGELHAEFAFGGCGDLVRPAPATDGPTASLLSSETDCHRFVVEYGLTAINRLPSEFEPLRKRLGDCLRDWRANGTTRARLFPWDLRPGNALVDDGSIAAVLDWERPMAAPAALALAKTEYLVADWYVDDPQPLRRAIHTGYESVRPVPAVRAVHRVVAIADSAIDSRGTVTNPGYPEYGRSAAVAFHRAALERALGA